MRAAALQSRASTEFLEQLQPPVHQTPGPPRDPLTSTDASQYLDTMVYLEPLHWLAQAIPTVARGPQAFPNIFLMLFIMEIH